MSRRAPVVVGLVLAVSGAVVASEAGDGAPVARHVGADPGVQMPAVQADDVVSSTWYCAAGSADSRLADHTVIVVNPGDEPVTGTVGVYSGRVASAPAPVDATGDRDDDAAGGDGGDGGDSAGEDRATPEGEEPVAEPEDGGGQSVAPGDDPSVGDPWGGEAAPAPAVVEEPLEVPAHGRTAIRLRDIVRAPLASALVEASGPVAVEHAVDGSRGRDVGPCASSASPDWYMAWGTTVRGARELLVLFNPFPSTAIVDISFATDDGIREPVRYQGLPIPAGGVVGLEVGNDVSREPQVAASIRTRSGSIVAERIVTTDGSREPYPEGLALALGAPSPLEAWAFADGRLTAGRQEWIVVYNPGREWAEVEVTVRPPLDEGADPPTPFSIRVRPGRFETIAYHDDERVPPDKAHSTLVRSTNGVPVVAERVQAEPADADDGDVSVALGAAFADRSWLFTSSGRDPEGSTRFVVSNPDLNAPASVSVTATVDGDQVAPEALQAVEIAPGARRELRVPPDTADTAASFAVTADLPVLVERIVTNRNSAVESVVPGILGRVDPLSVADIDAGR
jgi:hypothetical protein